MPSEAPLPPNSGQKQKLDTVIQVYNAPLQSPPRFFFKLNTDITSLFYYPEENFKHK